MAQYYATGAPSFKTSRTIQSDGAIDLHGPIKVLGSVKSGSNISLIGDFIIRKKIDANGELIMNGSLRCEDKISCGKLKVGGTLEGGDLTIYGDLTLHGYLKCQRLVVYGSLTLIGHESTWLAEVSQQIAGAVVRREREGDWEWD
ncbi:hypothetical protein B0T10DRAFT_566143 [Thelonectria olida]|uniref:Polymer-forming cytoskeletal protein n=1 Tax=Thelonectria olida TaxID=1576542 RepID=A0A9P9AKP5_9HYPO|nr:hypothetical protein B0T10DRAFT_566143 [Thelonectria olida]